MAPRNQSQLRESLLRKSLELHKDFVRLRRYQAGKAFGTEITREIYLHTIPESRKAANFCIARRLGRISAIVRQTFHNRTPGP
jgi:hypothetical protein